MRVLVIDNQDSFVYNLVQLLKRNGSCTYEIMQNDKIDFDRLDCFEKILLSPGPGLPSEAGEMLRLIRLCRETHPILGVCLGHQAIAEAFGGRLGQLPFPKHGHESRLVIRDTSDTLLRGIENGTKIGRYHSWIVEPLSLPSDLKISSVDEDGNIMSLYHTYLPIHGVQFHPESVISDAGQQFIDNWLGESVPPVGGISGWER